MVRVYIVRHGNTFDAGDMVTRVGARTDLPLSSSGKTQAEKLAGHFGLVEAEGFGEAFVSPLRRTQETAAAILALHDNAPSPEVLEFLREVDYGPDENRPEPDVIARIGEAALQAWEDDAIAPPGWIVDPAALVQGWKDLFVRLGASDGSPVLVVTSNGTARFALQAATSDGSHPLKLKTGAYGVVEVDADGAARVTDWNIRP